MNDFDQSSRYIDLRGQHVETQYIAGGNITFTVPPSKETVQERRNRKTMLDRVELTWITGLLDQSLHDAVLVALGLREQPDAIANPWRLTVQELEQPARILPSGTRMIEVYDHANGALLLLGEPGSGKTTLLLELTRDLLTRARLDDSHPVPVVFPLSSWAMKQQPLTEWLVEELGIRYHVPRKLAKVWIETNQVLPLLDGLDEVAERHRAACIRAINSYRHEHGLVPLVVCSRSAEYLNQPMQLQLHSAVVVQPLTFQQIDDALSSAGERLRELRTVLRNDPVLRELASTPLMLSVLMLTYHGMLVENLPLAGSLEQRSQQVWATYVQRMFQRRRASTQYTLQRTTSWLTWLAYQMVQHNQSEFYLERMQPDWLQVLGHTRLASSIGAYRLITTVIFAMLFFGEVGLLVGQAPGLGFGLVVGGLIGTLDGALNLILRFTWRKTWSWLRLLIKCCCFGLIGGLAFALLFRLVVGPFHGQDLGLTNGLLFGGIAAVFGLFVDRVLGAPDMNIKPAEVVTWSWKRMRQSLILFLCLGLAGGIIFALFYGIAIIILGLYFGLILGLFFGLIRGWSSKEIGKEFRTTPNRGTWLSARNGLRIGLRAGAVVGLIFGLSIGLFAIIGLAGNPMLLGINIVPDTGLPIPGWLEFAILFGLLYTLISGFFTITVVGLFSGWGAWIKHFVLRFLLSCRGYLPWNLSSFLDYATERIFLRKVGGGYIFIHRLLLDYFASLDTSSPSQETPLSSEYD